MKRLAFIFLCFGVLYPCSKYKEELRLFIKIKKDCISGEWRYTNNTLQLNRSIAKNGKYYSSLFIDGLLQDSYHGTQSFSNQKDKLNLIFTSNQTVQGFYYVDECGNVVEYNHSSTKSIINEQYLSYSIYRLINQKLCLAIVSDMYII